MSDKPFSKFSKFLTPKETIMASNKLSLKGKASESPIRSSILSVRFLLISFSFSNANELDKFVGFFNFSYDESKDKIYL